MSQMPLKVDMSKTSQAVLTLYMCGVDTITLSQMYGIKRSVIEDFLARHTELRPDVCQKGHSMADAPIKTNGRRNCRTCRRARDRMYRAAKRTQEAR